MGRRSYEIGKGDFTGYEFQVPIFVLTHQAPEQVAKGENDELTFTFVTEGIERVQGALDEVRPYLKSHGGNVELLNVDGGVAHLLLQGSCSGCPSSTVTLKLAIEEAIHKAAPDLEGIEAENVAAPRSVTLLSDLRAAKDEQSASWTTVGGLPQLTDGGHLVKEIGGEEVLFLKLENEFYSYRPRCPGCGASLERGSVQGGTLTCAECGYRYDARRAGRCLDAPQVYLEPIPLLVSAAGIVKVALPSFVG